MDYTDEQYTIIERLEAGLNYWNLSEDQQWILRYLQDKGIAQPRSDIADGHYLLTELGKRILKSYQKDSLVRAENIRREQEDKRKQLQQIAADKAERKAEKRAEHVFQIFLALLQALLSFVAGIFVEHFTGISDLIINLIKKFFA